MRTVTTGRQSKGLAASIAVATIALAALAATPARASVITWQTPQTISGPSDVINLGDVADAYSFQPAVPGNLSYSVNGITFNAFNIVNNTNPSSVGNVTVSGSGGESVLAYNAFGTPAGVGGVYGAMLNNGWYGGSLGGAISLTLTGLEPGAPYALQLWVNDARGGGLSAETESFTDGVNTSSPLTFGDPGMYVIGTFTADSTSETISTINQSHAVLLNAFALTTIPEPNSVLLGLVGAGLLAWRRRSSSRPR